MIPPNQSLQGSRGFLNAGLTLFFCWTGKYLKKWYPAKGNFFLQCLYAKLAISPRSRYQILLLRGTWKDWWHRISREIKFAALCRWGFGQPFRGAMVSLVASSCPSESEPSPPRAKRPSARWLLGFDVGHAQNVPQRPFSSKKKQGCIPSAMSWSW